MKVATLGIQLLFRHRTIDPAIITNTVEVQPTLQSRAGEHVRPAVDGTPRRGRNPESTWIVSTVYYDDPAAESRADLDLRLTAFLEPFQQHAPFVRQLAAECTAAAVDLELPGKRHFGDGIAPAVLRMVADLGLNLGIEVFPYGIEGASELFRPMNRD